MKLQLNQVEVNGTEVYIELENKTIILELDDLGFDEFVEEIVEETVEMYGGYAEFYNERQVYNSSEDYLDQHSYESVIVEIIECLDEKELEELFRKGRIETCCGDIIENKPEVYRCPTCKEAV